jgi:hypothetical protein
MNTIPEFDKSIRAIRYNKFSQHSFAVVKTAAAKHFNTTSQYSSAVVYKTATENTANRFLQYSSADAYKQLLQNTATHFYSVVLQMLQIATAKHCDKTTQYSSADV